MCDQSPAQTVGEIVRVAYVKGAAKPNLLLDALIATLCHITFMKLSAGAQQKIMWQNTL